MAKHNNVFLYGQITKKPVIKKDEDGKPISGLCHILVLRGLREFGSKIENLKYDIPAIMTGNPVHAAEMAKWEAGDMVEIKGSVTTKDIVKSTFCKHCGKKNTRKGNAVFINPIYMGRRETNVSEAERIELLKKRCEISNQVTLVGTLCREPQCFKTESGLTITTYQLAVNRKFRIKEDPAEIRTDFPWVKSYGSIAENDIKTLKKGSYVLIDGRIQARDIERTQVCEHCGQSYQWHDSALEIVPYATEYLRNFYTPEEQAQKDEEEYKKAIASVFSENDIVTEEAPPEDFDPNSMPDVNS